MKDPQLPGKWLLSILLLFYLKMTVCFIVLDYMYLEGTLTYIMSLKLETDVLGMSSLNNTVQCYHRTEIQMAILLREPWHHLNAS